MRRVELTTPFLGMQACEVSFNKETGGYMVPESLLPAYGMTLESLHNMDSGPASYPHPEHKKDEEGNAIVYMDTSEIPKSARGITLLTDTLKGLKIGEVEPLGIAQPKQATTSATKLRVVTHDEVFLSAMSQPRTMQELQELTGMCGRSLQAKLKKHGAVRTLTYSLP